MGLLEEMAKNISDKVVIPCTGKMFYSAVANSSDALTVPLNKGYYETDSLQSMLTFKESIDKNTVVFVGKVDKVVKHGGSYVYRQRLFIHSLVDLLQYMASSGVHLEIPSDFRIPINSMMNNLEDCRFLERIARLYRQSIDSYLKKVVLIQLYYLAEDIKVSHNLYNYYNKCLRRRQLKGILDYAPYLCTEYSIDKHTSSVYIYESKVGQDMFITDALEFGYRVSRIKEKFEKAKGGWKL